MEPTVSRKPFAVFDIDGTLIRWQLYHAVNDALMKRGHVAPEAQTAVKQARKLWKDRTSPESFMEYQNRVVDTYNQLLTKLTAEEFNTVIREVFDEYKDQTYTYTRNLIKDLKDRGYAILAISGSQHEIVGLLANYYGFDDYVGAKYEIKDGIFTGKAELTGGVKHIILESLITKHGLSKKGSVAVGDTESDISMLAAVENPLAFNPSAKLFDEAKKQDWKIVVERKNVVYELEKHNGTYCITT